MDVAKPNFSARLAGEWQAQDEHDARAAAAMAAEKEQGAWVQHVLPAKPGARMRILRREGKRVRKRSLLSQPSVNARLSRTCCTADSLVQVLGDDSQLKGPKWM